MSTDLVPSEHGELSATLFGTDNPAEVVQRAAVVATALADLVHKQNLVVRIGQSEHVRVEGWTLLGSMLGVFPVVTWTRPIYKPAAEVQNNDMLGWEARVEARTRAGEIVGAAESECLRTENTWKNRDDYALRSMAQTRAVSKALRLPLGFVMQLAGFNPTPAEEMPLERPTVDMYDPDIPFGDAPQPEHQPKPLKKGEPMYKKLGVLVGTLRPEKVSTLELYEFLHRKPIPSEDGELHWGPLLATLTKSEAHSLIDWLEALSSSGVPNDRDESPGQAGAASGHGESPDAPVPQAVSGEPATPDETSTSVSERDNRDEPIGAQRSADSATHEVHGKTHPGTARSETDETMTAAALTARLIASSSKKQEAAYMIEQHAKDHTPVEHHQWLMVQERKRFGGDAT